MSNHRAGASQNPPRGMALPLGAPVTACAACLCVLSARFVVITGALALLAKLEALTQRRGLEPAKSCVIPLRRGEGWLKPLFEPTKAGLAGVLRSLVRREPSPRHHMPERKNTGRPADFDPKQPNEL